MASVEIRSYTLHTGQLGSLGAEQMIVVHHVARSGPGSEEQGVSRITFSDRFANRGGFGVIAGAEAVEAYLPAAAYTSWVDLLRNEDPIFLHWSSDNPGEYDAEATIHLSTGPEPTGEGPVDFTP